MQSTISRRAVLAGVPAVAPDPILPVYKQWRAAVAEIEDISARIAACIPADVRAARDAYPYPAAAPQDVQEAYDHHYEASDCGALDEAAEAIGDRITDLECRIMETPAASLHGLLAKAHIARYNSKPGPKSPEGGTLDDGPMILTIFQDLERLIGGDTGKSTAMTTAETAATGDERLLDLERRRLEAKAQRKKLNDAADLPEDDPEDNRLYDLCFDLE